MSRRGKITFVLGLATKKDYKLVSIIGILFGLFSLPILENIKIPGWQLTLASGALVVVGFLIFAIFSMWVAGLIGLKSPALFQFAKYGAAGALSAFLDLGILNLFSLIFKIYSGPALLVFNVFSFLVATTNAYFWNKFWAFKKEGDKPNIKEYARFICVTLTGLVINTAIVFILTTVIGAPAGVSAAVWENVAKFSAIIPNVMWNFVGYKFFIFKS
ncbi:MAG: GtrA family protein [bacterium]|nr:GtrA family protein [bacterium]